MIYFTRHGESEANLKGVFAGQRDDSALTPKGIKEAKATGNDIKRKKLQIDRIIASPLKRSKETANIIADCIGLDRSTIELDERLSEYDMGSLSGTPKKNIKAFEYTSAPDAEDVSAFQDRVMGLLQEIKTFSGNTLIVSHSGVGRIIEATRLNKPIHDFYELEAYPNAKVVLLDI